MKGDYIDERTGGPVGCTAPKGQFYKGVCTAAKGPALCGFKVSAASQEGVRAAIEAHHEYERWQRRQTH